MSYPLPPIPAQPCTRWWWFNGPIREEDIRAQLDWLRANNFGGVEIAFMYAQSENGGCPQLSRPAEDSASRPVRGPQWLSPEWSRLVALAKHYAESIGLGCDFTLGSAWPFGGSIVEERDASRTFEGLARQRLEKSWENGDCTGFRSSENRGCPRFSPPLRILNHLDRNALERYAQKMGAALHDALPGRPSALFCDSFEVDPEGLWTDGFDQAFIERFGYDVRPFMPELASRTFPSPVSVPLPLPLGERVGVRGKKDERESETSELAAVRYDYRKLISEYVLNEFYRPFTEICHRLGAYSRVQCLGTPTDLLAAYCAMDVPESEAILFDPHFSQFAASASAIGGKPVTSAESFTCLYGWVPYPGPGPYQGQEQIADIKLLADSLFANGINRIVWHGMPYNPPVGSNRFYASVHVGPDSAFADQLPEFNEYLSKVSSIMRQGRTCSDVAVYLPLEDNWIRDRLPPELKRPSAEYYWELQYQRFPDELRGYRPLWVSMGLLRDAEYRDGKLHCGAAEFSSLYIDVEWLDHDALRDVVRLALQGLPICLKRVPQRPGRSELRPDFPDFQYIEMLRQLVGLPNVRENFARIAVNPPLVAGENLPEFWARVEDGTLRLFFAHPKSRGLHYPMSYGQSLCTEQIRLPITVNFRGCATELELGFEPYQSLVIEIEESGPVRTAETTFHPRLPLVR